MAGHESARTTNLYATIPVALDEVERITY